jgi:hypothetical protein
MLVHNALVGVGLRDRIKVGASGKVATGSDIVKRLIQGADYTNAARAMMMATGCIQSQRCHTNQCPVGVATQDPTRARALDVADKSVRVQRFQQATVTEAQQIMASMGARCPSELGPHQLRRRIGHMDTRSYAELYTWLAPGELLAEPPRDWAGDWARADPDASVTEPTFHSHLHPRRSTHVDCRLDAGHRAGRPRREDCLGGRGRCPQPHHRRDPYRGSSRVDRGPA